MHMSSTSCMELASTQGKSATECRFPDYEIVRSYWDFAVNGTDEYSYVSAAAAAGYTTFRYDRLGTGLSEKPADAYK